MTDDDSPADDPRLDVGDAFTGPARHAGARRRRRSKRARCRYSRRAIVLGVGVLAIGGAAWLVITAFMARSDLDRVNSGLSQLRVLVSQGKIDDARQLAQQLSRDARHAHTLTTGPAWFLSAGVPYLGDPLDTVRGATATVDQLGATMLPALITVSADITPGKVRTAGNRIDITRLALAAPALHLAAAQTQASTATVTKLPRHTWLPAVDDARRSLATELIKLRDSLTSADQAAQVLPPMLGAGSPQRYFVGLQNEAEARGTGGLPGAFAIIVANHGMLSFTNFEPDNALNNVTTALDFGADYDAHYGKHDSTVDYLDSNVSPHFPYAAQVWASMWQRKSGQKIDGAIAIDPTALSYLLAVTGPATLPDGSQITADNVVALTQQGAYARFDDQAQRKHYLLDVARVIDKRLLSGSGDTTALVRAAGRAAGQRRLLVWSANPAIETVLARTPFGGVVPDTAAPFVGLSIVNVAANKLDYYLDRTMTWRRTGCGTIRPVTVTITLTNNAPPTGLTPYQTARQDKHSYPVKRGDNRLFVSYLATAGAQMTAVSVDGEPATAAPGREIGHPLYTVDLELPRGRSRTIVLSLTEPAGVGAPVVLRQPLVRPLHLTLDAASCD